MGVAREEDLPDLAHTLGTDRELALSIAREPARYPLLVLAKAEVESMDLALVDSIDEDLETVARRDGWFHGDPLAQTLQGDRQDAAAD